MSTCTRCGTVLVPGSTFCHSCGLPLMPMAAPAIPVMAPAGTQRALIGSTPLYQAIVGFFMIIMGFIVLSWSSMSPTFGAFALIPLLFGAVLLVLGLMGKPIMAQQVVFQTDQPASYGSQASVKWCRSCGAELLASANECYRCGAAQ